EHDAQRDRPRDHDLEQQVREVAIPEEVAVLGVEERPDQRKHDQHRNDPVLTRDRLEQRVLATWRSTRLSTWRGRGRDLRGPSPRLQSAHDRTPVIAATSSSELTSPWRLSNSATLRPSRSTTMRSATSST